MIGDMFDLAWPRRDSELLDRRRAEAIVERVRAFAQLFAVLALAWSAVDTVAFEGSTLLDLMLLRVAACAAFMTLAHFCRDPHVDLRGAELRLAMLFVIPALLFLASTHVLAATPSGEPSTTIASLYSLVPFVLAVGIGAFPLSAVEAAALATVALIAEGWALAWGAAPIEPLVALGAFWLLALIAMVATYSAMSQLRLLEQLARQVMRDPLTGCHRRESGKEFLEMQFLIAARHETPLAVLFADLDRFKTVNDRFGHEEGDRALAAAAEGLRRMTRESDIVLRWGGEEFVVVLPHTTREEAVALLDRLRERGIGRSPDGRPMTVSIGIAEYLADGVRTADELVELADRRMYRAKQAGRNRYVDSSGREPAAVFPDVSSTVSR